MMHEIAVNCIDTAEPVRFGLNQNLTMGRTRARGLGKGTSPLHEDLHQQDCGFPQGRYFALLL